jgi:hypothetical protein
MNKSEFEKYNNYKGNIFDYIIATILLGLYCILLIYFIAKSNKICSAIQKMLFKKDGDIFFSISSNAYFLIPFSMFLMCGLYYIIFFFMKSIPVLENTRKWIEIINIKGKHNRHLDYDSYTKKKKRYNIIIISIIILSCVYSIFLIVVHLRINNNGIYYTKYFSLLERKYLWDDLSSVSVYFKYEILDNGKRQNILPKMELQFSENNVELWQNAGIGSPNADTLIYTMEMIKKKTNVNINAETELNETLLNILNNFTEENKRVNIEKVLNYIKNNEKLSAVPNWMFR